MRVALVHDYIKEYGGAERVLEALHEIWPDAPVFTTVYLPEFLGPHKERFNPPAGGWNIKTSWLQILPFKSKLISPIRLIAPFVFKSFDFSRFDVVLADASAFAKGVKVPPKTMLVCYCHTPTRYLWLDGKSYVEALSYPAIIKALIPPVLAQIKKWDVRAAQRPHHYIANSKTVSARIKRFYNRDSIVVYPPVDTEFFNNISGKENYYFAASRLEPYKKIELVVEAFNDLGLPLKIAGSGTASLKLRKMAKSNIEFLGRVSDEELRRRYSEAQAFIFPAIEDAGIMPIEAMSCGTPVIALGEGGALETVLSGKTGLFFKEPTSSSLKATIANFHPDNFNREVIREHARQFDKHIFRAKIKSLIEGWYKEFDH